MADDGSLGILQYLVLLPGRYSVRSRATDGTVRERWVEIDVGESVSVQSLEQSALGTGRTPPPTWQLFGVREGEA